MTPDEAPETPEYVADGYVVDHHDPESYVLRCPDCEETDTSADRPGESARICSACNRLMGVTPVRPQRSGWAARAARGEDVGEPMTDGGNDEDLPEVAYESDHRGGHGGKLHLDDECTKLATDDPGEVSLSAMPPAFRRWCRVCGPDGEPQRPPRTGSGTCSECERHVGNPALVDGVCLGCHEFDDEEDRRLVADGGNEPEVTRVDVERGGSDTDGGPYAPTAVTVRVRYCVSSHGGRKHRRMNVGYRMEGATATIHRAETSQAGGGCDFQPREHVTPILAADEKVLELPFVQGVTGLRNLVRSESGGAE